MAKITGSSDQQQRVTVLEEFTYWTHAFLYKNYVEDNRTHRKYNNLDRGEFSNYVQRNSNEIF